MLHVFMNGIITIKSEQKFSPEEEAPLVAYREFRLKNNYPWKELIWAEILEVI